MESFVHTDIVPFAKNILLALKPIADSKKTRLIFLSNKKKIPAFFSPAGLAVELIEKISGLLQIASGKQEVVLCIEIISKEECIIKIKISGADVVHGKTNVFPVSITGETEYAIKIALTSKEPKAVIDPVIPSQKTLQALPEFYFEIRKRLRSHFSKADNLVAGLSTHNPKEVAFLKRINALIFANLDNTQFDANHLSIAMNMSRTQLYRRLKPIIRQSTGSYIQTLKLQKAKELFETTDLRINEVSYRTGFESPSHFTKAFTKLYGLKPSLFCKSQCNK